MLFKLVDGPHLMAIEGVLYEKRGIDHEDERRALLTAFNGDLGDFAALQVKFARMHKDAVLGGHYHNYRELFYLLDGEATFDLMDIQTKEKEQYTLAVGNRILIPARVAHKGFVKQGSILVGCTEEKYVSPAHNDHKYDF